MPTFVLLLPSSASDSVEGEGGVGVDEGAEVLSSFFSDVFLGGEVVNGVEKVGVVEDAGELRGGLEHTASVFVKLRLAAEGRKRGPRVRAKGR